ncbi:MAG: hypothetical protein MUF34_34890 [Polyangiaceae bacterium]|jgi:hypothetical protein|nr:hypothetical protein [Polyangiaceae bacterium]
MNDLELAAIVIALVGVVRARNAAGEPYLPALDGNAVPLVAAIFGAVVSLLSVAAPPLLAMAHGVAIGLVAVGTMTALKYVGDKVGTALGRAVALARPKNGTVKAHGDEVKGGEGAPYA